jgi:hypothetical protein
MLIALFLAVTVDSAGDAGRSGLPVFPDSPKFWDNPVQSLFQSESRASLAGCRLLAPSIHRSLYPCSRRHLPVPPADRLNCSPLSVAISEGIA